MTNVKKIGSDFEHEFCRMLTEHGFWNHFFTPDARGAQPFDVIAVKDGCAYAIDCKTCVANNFSIDRLEDNQVLAFSRWGECGNGMPWIAVKHKNEVHMIPYINLIQKSSVRIAEYITFDKWVKTLIYFRKTY